MEIKIECPWCNQHYSVDESFIGQNVECSVCGKQFAVRKTPVSTPPSSSNSSDTKATESFRTSFAAASENRTVDDFSNESIPTKQRDPVAKRKGIITLSIICVIGIIVSLTACLFICILRSKKMWFMEQLESTGVVSLPNGVELQMVKVEAGSFEMGKKDGDNLGNEFSHRVTLKHDFYIGKTEVTQAQWKAVMTNNPSSWKSDDLPVEHVSWEDAQEFCKRMNEIFANKLPDGYRFDLPTEAQWEFAARGGNKSSGYKYSGSAIPSVVAWHADNSGNKPHPVGQKQANELGLYDMCGNVAEWCRDWYENSFAADPEFLRGNIESPMGQGETQIRGLRVIRGGNYGSNVVLHCRVASRFVFSYGKGLSEIGFRLALVPIEEDAQANETMFTDENMNQSASVKEFIFPGSGGVGLYMIKVEAGTFTMGANDDENDSNEKPHVVNLKHDFYIGQTEVTQAQWKEVANSNPSRFKGDDLPVEQVSWEDAHAFCKELNELFMDDLPEGYHFDLPTEAQWEYAARGGNKSCGYKYSGSGITDSVAWFIDSKSNLETHPVGMKLANELGLYDMSGNVHEWCRDWYEEDYADDPEFLRGNVKTLQGKGWILGPRVKRGGSFISSSFRCRVASRQGEDASMHLDHLGFRLALVPIQ